MMLSFPGKAERLNYVKLIFYDPKRGKHAIYSVSFTQGHLFQDALAQQYGVAFQMITCSWSAAISCHLHLLYFAAPVPQCLAFATGPDSTGKEQDNDHYNQQDVEEEGSETLAAHLHHLSCLEQFTPRRILQHIVHVPQCSYWTHSCWDFKISHLQPIDPLMQTRSFTWSASIVA